jgi:peptide/nickel transport system substrate-binding protein
MGFNLADPANPQPGLDAEGNYVEQGIHPIFGDANVRIAIAHALDVIGMIGTRPEGDNAATGILEGNGYPIATHNSQTSTIDPGVAPREYDPELAMQMLEDAGWTDSDGNGIRECHGCLYATTVDAAYEGHDLAFELITNSGNLLREAAGESIRLQLAEVGIQVDYQAIEFSTLITEARSQTFDAIILGWTGLYIPFTPGAEILSIFGAPGDAPGAGFNFMSLQNQEMEALINQADSLPAAADGSYPACDRATRDGMYAEVMRMLYENPPYVWLYTPNVMIAAQGSVENWDPVPFSPRQNMDAWNITIQN